MTPRWFFVDALRILAFALLVPYHVGMAYVSWPWHVKAAQLVPAIEPLMQLSNPWRMSLLFLLSGTALGLMLQSERGQRPWLAARLKRLGLPLLLGIGVIVPVQPYLEVVQHHGYRGSFVEFLGLYFGAYGGFCSPTRGCLVLPTWNHLWFLAYLIVYTLLAAGALRRWPSAATLIATRLPGVRGALWIVMPIAWLVLTRLVLRERFPPTHALIDDAYLHSQYLPMFALGIVLAQAPAAWKRFEALRWHALVLAVAAWSVWQIADPGRGAAVTMAMLLVSTVQWCALLAACGFAHRHLNRDFAWRRRLTDAVLPLYLLHQSVIVAAVAALAPLALPPAIEAPLLLALAFGVSGATVVALNRVRWLDRLRPWFGLAGLRKTRAAAVLARPA